MKTVYKGFFALAFVVFESALATIALQVGGSSIGAVPFLLYSLIATAVVMAVVAYFQDNGRGFFSLFKNRNMLVMLLLIGIFSYAIGRLTLTLGTLGTTPSVSGILFRTYPLMVAILTPLTLRQKISRRQFIALLLGFLSAGIVLSNGSLTSFNLAELPYVALILISALGTASSTLLVNRYNLSSTGFILFASIISVMFTIPIVLAFHISIPVNLSLATWTSIILIGAVFGGIGSMFFYYAYKVFNSSFTGLVMLTIPFFTVIMSFLILKTPMQPYYFLAAGVLMLGALIQGKNTLRAPEHIKKHNTINQMQIFDVTSAFIQNKSELFYDCLKGGGRALAIKLYGREYENKLHSEIFKKRDCIAFTNKEPHASVEKNELEFINEIVGLNGQETLLIGVGGSDNIVSAFEDFTSLP